MSKLLKMAGKCESEPTRGQLASRKFLVVLVVPVAVVIAVISAITGT
jgi:hypothetical protein